MSYFVWVALVWQLFPVRKGEYVAEKGQKARLKLRSWVVSPNEGSHARQIQTCVHVWLEPKPLVWFGTTRMCVCVCVSVGTRGLTLETHVGKYRLNKRDMSRNKYTITF